jgi:mono/diheme cytochrome c family protein
MNRLLTSVAILVALAGSLAAMAVDQSWKQHISDKDRGRANPYAGQQDAVAAGSRLFGEYCTKCHGENALGNGKRPSLRTTDVQNASDGEIFWLLRNGYLRRGMPSWSSLPDASRWQLVAYLKSLGVSEENHSSDLKDAKKDGQHD